MYLPISGWKLSRNIIASSLLAVVITYKKQIYIAIFEIITY